MGDIGLGVNGKNVAEARPEFGENSRLVSIHDNLGDCGDNTYEIAGDDGIA
jgi:hypothetical protein